MKESFVFGGRYCPDGFYHTLRLDHDDPSAILSGRIVRGVPKLWDESIDAHRRAVRDATLDTTAALVAEHGVRAVTMSQIAERTGIGRATLYKYFPDIDAILAAWHERQVHAHLQQLESLAGSGRDVVDRLEDVLLAYAQIQHEHREGALAAQLHQGEHMDHARQHLRQFVGGLLAEGTTAGAVREDIASDELASYCLHALSAASTLPSKAAVRRLVTVTLDGLRRV